MKVLVIGSGAREHALCHSLSHDPDVTALHCAPGNAGIAEVAELHQVDASNGAAVTELATRLGAELVVVGPEAPLVAGVADAVRDAGIPVFGPSGRAAQLEGSKAFAKDVMAAAEVPTARSYVCTTPEEADAALDAFGAPYVVKDDGLAAGKGVVVTDDLEAARAHAAACERVVIEDVQAEPSFAEYCTDAAAAGFRAVHSTPLVSSSGVKLGILSPQFRRPHRPSERELRFTELYARQAANIIEHGRA